MNYRLAANPTPSRIRSLDGSRGRRVNCRRRSLWKRRVALLFRPVRARRRPHPHVAAFQALHDGKGHTLQSGTSLNVSLVGSGITASGQVSEDAQYIIGHGMRHLKLLLCTPTLYSMEPGTTHRLRDETFAIHTPKARFRAEMSREDLNWENAAPALLTIPRQCSFTMSLSPVMPTRNLASRRQSFPRRTGTTARAP